MAIKPIEIVVGRGNPYDPSTGDTAYNNPNLAGQDLYIELYGSGPVPYENYQVLSTGGFQWLLGNSFGNNGQTIFIYLTGISAPVAGAYSNGFQFTNVLNALLGRVGWRQPTISGFTTLTGLNTTSNSGRYFQDFHAIVTPQNLKTTQEDLQISDVNFNTFLLNLQKAAIMRSLNGVFNKRDRLEQKLLFERFGRQDYLNVPYAVPTFVGVRITAPRSFDKAMQIDSLALYFNQNVSFNFYLFHDASPGVPIATVPVTANANQQTIVKLNQFVLNYVDVVRSGYFYFGYFQPDLGGAEAYNEIIEKFNQLYNFGCTPVELLKVGSTGINVNQVAFTIKTHGFNMQMSAFRDHTQAILNAPYIFDELIGLNMAAMVIETIQNSTNSNFVQRVTAEASKMLYNDLNLAMTTDEFPYATGIKNAIKRELYRVKREFYPTPKVETNTHDTEDFRPYGIPELDLFRY